MSRAGKLSVDNQPQLVWQTWLVSRLLIVVTAAWVMVSEHRSRQQILTAWDVLHFQTIARNGYVDPMEMAFFPGLPAILAAGESVGLPMSVTGVGLSLLGSALAAWALFRIGGVIPACLWLLLPTSVFTVVAYTEAPFAAAAFWAWERALKGKWLQAALLAGLACSFRVSGLFLIAALVVMALTERGTLKRWWQLGWLLIPVGVIVGYLWFLHGLTGSWTAWFDAQKSGWGRGFNYPWDALQNTLRAARPSSWPGRELVAWVFATEIAAMAVGVATVVYCLIRKWWAEASWVAVQVVVFGTSYWFMSVNRAMLLWFPVVLATAEIIRRRPRHPTGRLLWSGAVTVGIVASAVAMVLWSWLFFTGNWAS